jgi:hypothetical protein
MHITVFAKKLDKPVVHGEVFIIKDQYENTGWRIMTGDERTPSSGSKRKPQALYLFKYDPEPKIGFRPPKRYPEGLLPQSQLPQQSVSQSQQPQGQQQAQSQNPPPQTPSAHYWNNIKMLWGTASSSK